MTALLFTAIVLIEIRLGFLRQFKTYFKSVRPQFYQKVLIAAIFAVAILLWMDEPLLRFVQKIQTPWILEIIAWAAFWGRGQNTWAFLALLYALTWILRKTWTRQIIFYCMIASGLTSLVVSILKSTFARARPLMHFGPYHFFDHAGLIRDGNEFKSFPSGDVAVAAGAATFLFLAIKNPTRWIYPMIAFLVCLSRMILDKHWPSDVAFSFIISFAMAKFVLDYLKFSVANNQE